MHFLCKLYNRNIHSTMTLYMTYDFFLYSFKSHPLDRLYSFMTIPFRICLQSNEEAVQRGTLQRRRAASPPGGAVKMEASGQAVFASDDAEASQPIEVGENQTLLGSTTATSTIFICFCNSHFFYMYFIC